jgi:hypothetical protein
MMVLAFATLAIALIAWFTALCAWFVFAYHIAMGAIRWLLSDPQLSRLTANLLWFRRGMAGLRDTLDSEPPLSAHHRKKANKAGAVIIGCIVIAMLAAAIGGRSWSIVFNG